MTLQETTFAKIHQLPDSLVKEVHDYVDFLLTRHDFERWEAMQNFMEGRQIAEEGMSTYLSDLEDYETQLEQGRIKW